MLEECGQAVPHAEEAEHAHRKQDARCADDQREELRLPRERQSQCLDRVLTGKNRRHKSCMDNESVTCGIAAVARRELYNAAGHECRECVHEEPQGNRLHNAHSIRCS